MDELGLGTKSTRHDIISKLYARAYVQGNPIKPTNTAYAVVDTLEKYAPTITKPEMTQILEKEMQAISDRKIGEAKVLEESREMLSSVFDELLENKDQIGVSLKDGLRTDKIVGKCERCGSDLIVRRGRRGSRFIGCSGYPDCRFTLPLPKSGTMIVTDKVCDLHHMNHVRIINKGKRPWDLGCPHCNFLEWQARKEKEGGSEGTASSGKSAGRSRPSGGSSPKPKGDGLKSIQGLGPKSLEKLDAAGIKTVDDLAKAESITLAGKTGISHKKIAIWQSAARAKVASAAS